MAGMSSHASHNGRDVGLILFVCPFLSQGRPALFMITLEGSEGTEQLTARLRPSPPPPCRHLPSRSYDILRVNKIIIFDAF